MDTKRYLVTGAAKPGYGTAITKRLLAEGQNVIGSYEIEDQDNAEALLKEYAQTNRLQLMAINHGNRQELAKLVDAAKTLPLAGIVHGQFFFAMENPESFDYDQWDFSLAVNLTAPNYLTHELKNDLISDSSVIVITSTEGFIGSFGASSYAACKAAIHNLVKTLANNLGSRSIRVNAIAAGWIGGVMDTDEVFNMSRRITPLSRLGRAEEIASVAWFLLSSESSFVNGTVITADGGYTGVDTISKYEFEQSKNME